MMQSVRTVRKEINSTSTNRNVTIMSEKYLLEYTSGTNILGKFWGFLLLNINFIHIQVSSYFPSHSELCSVNWGMRRRKWWVIILHFLEHFPNFQIDIIAILEKAVMKLISWIMWVAPIGIFSLITGSVLGAGDFFAFLQIIGLVSSI